MQVLGQRGTNATFDVLHLSEQEIVVDHYLDAVVADEAGTHVLHALRHCHHLLWHAIAHGNPGIQQCFLGECRFLLLIRNLHIGLSRFLSLSLAQALEGDAELVELQLRRCRR